MVTQVYSNVVQSSANLVFGLQQGHLQHCLLRCPVLMGTVDAVELAVLHP